MQTSSAITLNRQNLSQLANHVQVPDYRVEDVKTGIVHIGVGGFHRAHQAMYTDALMSQTGELDWGICGIGLREGDRKMQQILAAQDYLYTLVEKHAGGERKARVIGAITDFLIATDSPAAIIEKMAEPTVKLVSLTITEGGYNLDSATGEFMADNADVQYDLQNPQTPKLVFGYLLAALKLRKQRGIAPFTLMSCDNIQHNGDVLKKMLLAYIELADGEFASWVNEHVMFPNSMVDRITPSTTQEDIDQLAEQHVIDGWPVVCEPFTQWIIEDAFCNERPAWEAVGAQFVPAVSPYEKLKLRMLNAGHSVLGLCGSLADTNTIHESMQVDALKTLLSNFMSQEVMPTLDPVEGIDVEQYKQTLLERFANPNIKDSLARICLQSSAKIPVFLLPTVQDNLRQQGQVKISALVLACWCYYSDKQQSQQGTSLDIQDDMAERLHQAAAQTSENPLAFLQLEAVFGQLASQPDFTQLYTDFVKRLYAGEDVLKMATTI